MTLKDDIEAVRAAVSVYDTSAPDADAQSVRAAAERVIALAERAAELEGRIHSAICQLTEDGEDLPAWDDRWGDNAKAALFVLRGG